MPGEKIRSVGIVAKPKIPKLAEILTELINWLKEREIHYTLSETTAKALDPKLDGPTRTDLPRESDIIIVLGGDGTILSVGPAAAEAGIPLVGINMGHLGFLAEVTAKEMYTTLENIIAGKYEISERLLLEGELIRNCEVIESYRALNDFVLDNTKLARMIETEVFLDNEFVIRFRADGLIVSSPTGSTAYNLSAGGPILHPGLDAFVVTPICPHTMTYRPLVVNGQSVIELITHATEGESYLTVDGQKGVKLMSKDKIRITESKYHLKLIQSETKDYFHILNEKLQWGGRRHYP
ncbi:MAG: NAD(+)/NADH kinase [Acidobacteria bacterium]|nr:NAD(+)/NADH kinase [Acidobacteriota bacterium]